MAILKSATFDSAPNCHVEKTANKQPGVTNRLVLEPLPKGGTRHAWTVQLESQKRCHCELSAAQAAARCNRQKHDARQ